MVCHVAYYFMSLENQPCLTGLGVLFMHVRTLHMFVEREKASEPSSMHTYILPVTRMAVTSVSSVLYV